jgi:hypothetical protein
MTQPFLGQINGWHEQNRNGVKTPKTEVFWVLGTPNYKS